VAGDTERIGAYYVPGIGPCPKWCAYIDNLTEQFEEKGTSTIYTDYKFVTKEDLEALNVGNLVGTPYLRFFQCSLLP
jgi:ribosome biogenesis protein ENP2